MVHHLNRPSSEKTNENNVLIVLKGQGGGILEEVPTERVKQKSIVSTPLDDSSVLKIAEFQQNCPIVAVQLLKKI
jgi:hypothetical protein